MNSKTLSPLLIALLLVVGCTPSETSQAETPSASQTPTIAPLPVSTPEPSPPANPLMEAEDIAQGAIAITQSASSQSDWQTVVQQWERAIALLKSVPDSHPQKEAAEEKLVQYKKNLASAQKQANKKTPQPSVSSTATSRQAKATVTQSSGQTAQNPPSSSPSSNASLTIALVRHLNNIGAKMYGTYWCGACKWQREQFGAEFSKMKEIECDPRGKNAQPNLCKKAGIRAYPTWEIDGQLINPGALSLEKLADISGYSGDRDFR
ncbi:hypothetical protein IQ249_01540 [Lusitaniella coriacea LEGE 07157]|uniref:Thioredoxin domain-containing protein n=1 Tax=Lusitaniella coriacea LEGE 07157 TaxID=945747 RepID=A0A8J7B8J1_9CYAN|nr:hypothetical protein [Lusitaniella coriacea]MBE9114568.1 hypothetical protein [Lusitaniella coriacea LEGE 07157]